MDLALARVVAFFVDNFPSPGMLAAGVPLGLGWAWLCLGLCGRLKARRGWKTGYTRKLFHFLIFGTVALLQRLWGTSAVCLFGGMTSLVVLHAIVRGAGHPHYEAMAREQDAPHRTYFIVAPYAATLLGGLAANIVFGPLALLGYLVAGVGDAVGEPAGTRFGRHPYRVPSLSSVPTTRTLEGSLAVLLASALACLAAVALSPVLALDQAPLYALPLIAVASALAEAVSPHGWDNATMQLVPTALSWWLFAA